MSKTFQCIAATFLIAGSIVLPLAATPAQSFPASLAGSQDTLAPASADNPAFTTVTYRHKWRRGHGHYHGGHGHYHGHYHGHHGHGHGYGGYYGYPGFYWGYPSLWMNYGGLYNGYGYDYYDYDDRSYGGGGSHVQWCRDRYRSYNPRTDTFMGYDGRRHRCRGPY